MSSRRARRIIGLALATLVFVLPVFGAPAQAADVSMRVRAIEIKDYPRVVLTVSLPPEATTQTLKRNEFTLFENGKRVERLEVKPIAQARQPVGIVLALDASGSMRGKPLFDAKDAARVFIDEMKQHDKIAIISFSTTPQLLADFTSDKTTLYEALSRITADGETAFYDAIYLALDTGAAQQLAQQNIVILSDGRDTVSQHPAPQIIDRAISQKAAVFTFGLSSPDFAEAPLRELADRTGGRYALATDSQALAGFYAGLAKELHNQYQLTYTSRSDTKAVSVKIEARPGAQQVLTTSRSFTAPVTSAAPSSAGQAASLPAPVTQALKSPWVQPAIVGLAFLFWLMLALVVASFFLPVKNILKDQIEIYKDTGRKGQAAAEESETQSYLANKPIISQAVRMTGSLAEKGGFTQDIQLGLERSGLPLRASEFIFLHTSFAVVAGLIGLLLFDSWLLRLLIVLVGSTAPLLLLAQLKRNRENRLHDQLPDTLDLLAGGLKAGYSFLQAVDVTTQETAPPISTEFKRVLAETRLGLPLEQALDHMAERVHSTSVDWTVMAVKIQREVGGNLAEVLETLADTIRQRDSVYRQIKVLTAEGRLSAIILFLLPLVLAAIIFFVNPGYISALFSTSVGLALIAVAVVLMLVGALWLRKIVAIEV